MNYNENEHLEDSNDEQSTDIEKKEDSVESNSANTGTTLAKSLYNATSMLNPSIYKIQNDTALKALNNAMTKFNPAINNIYSDTTAEALANAVIKFNPIINNIQSDTAFKALNNAMSTFNPAINHIQNNTSLKALTNAMTRFNPALYNTSSTIVAKNITEQITKIYPTFNNYNISAITGEIKRHLENIEVFSQVKIPSETYLNSLSGKTKISIAEQDLSDTINSVPDKEIDDWVDTLATNDKKGLSYCLRYDIYPPIFLLDRIPFSQEFNSQQEADKYFKNLLDILSENNNTVFDCIPKTNENQSDIQKIKQLFELSYYKILILYLLERIENLLNKIRFKYTKKTIKDRTTQQAAAEEFFTALFDNTDDKKLKDILKEIFKVKLFNNQDYFRLNLYENFSKNEEVLEKIGTKEIPLNRNIFMHGHVEDEHISELLVKKAILAFGFFTSLAMMIKNN